MSRTHLRWVAPWIALGLGVCAATPIEARESREVSKACAEWRLIAIKKQAEGGCPPVPGWEAELLFARPERKGRQDYAGQQPDPSTAARRDAAARELQRFCVYEADPKPGRRRPFEPSPDSGLVQFDRDCAAISRAAEPAPAPQTWETFQRQLLSQAGRPSSLPLEIKNRMGVRLAFLDTQPDKEAIPDKPGRSEHGYTLAHIARHLVCGPEKSDPCAAKITTRLALPIVEFDPARESGTRIDTVNGGYIGFQSHLAKAIRDEVDAWQENLRERRDEPKSLVLNISAAWDGELFGGLRKQQLAELQAGTQAVYRALEYAAEFDVLVLAAAGNKKSCPESTTGPLLPAAWEEGTPSEGSREPPKAPLLYAVGGVDSRDHPLANARPGGMPRRAAYGQNGVVSLPDGNSTNMYSGTSVSTAVVSSIAAVVWDTLPGASSARVMGILDRSETPLPLEANFWFGSSAAARDVAHPRVRRLSLCTALQKACGEPGAVNCPLPPGLKTCPPPVTLTTEIPSEPRTCNPWLGPQPEEDPCPICKPPRG